MKILQVNDHGHLLGGAEAYIADVTKALTALGHDSHLLYFNRAQGALIASDSSWIDVNAGALREDVERSVPLVNAIERFDPDIIYTHIVSNPWTLALLNSIRPTIAYVHSAYIACPGSALYWRSRKQICNRSAGLACLFNAQIKGCCWGRNPLTHWRALTNVRRLLAVHADLELIIVGSLFMKRVLNRNGIPEAKIKILPPVLFDDDGWETAVNGNLDPDTLLFVGRLVPEKGLGILLQSCARVNRNWRLIVAGDGPNRPDYECLAHELGIAERVTFKGWTAEVHALMHQCACVIVPSLWAEPFGRTGPEAFRAGRPVIAFAVGGVPDWLEHNITGLLVSAGNVGSLARAIEFCLQHPERAVEMGQTAQAKAFELYKKRKHIAQLLEWFREIM